MGVHQPVLLQEVIAGLLPKPGQTILDATINRAGHAKVIAERLGRAGHLIGLDADPEAIAEARTVLHGVEPKVSLVARNFRQLDEVLRELGVKAIDAALFDLGLSSDQLETSGRGFSFQDDEPLAMSFGSPEVPGRLTAKEIVNHWREESLADVIYGYGEETFARRIAKAIVESRRRAPLETTNQLVEVIRGAVPGWYTHRRLNPATKTFQALRIAVNDELGALREALPKVWEKLVPGGRLAIISFHSLEARILKEQFRLWVASGAGKLIAKKPILPSREEAVANPRSRSAQLRLIQKQ